ncbi:hypothetical protein PV408_32360, partial [Streptomyces sp. ME18-1-4]|nr:hypothetical protein [Streptomyces sp. ME18-1-4]
MNKNIRRSLVIAAGVSGAWALGSAVASADELPAASVSTPDVPTTDVTDVTDATDSLKGTVSDTLGTVTATT